MDSNISAETVEYYATLSEAELNERVLMAREAFETSAVVSRKVLNQEVTISPAQAEKLLLTFRRALALKAACAADGVAPPPSVAAGASVTLINRYYCPFRS